MNTLNNTNQIDINDYNVDPQNILHLPHENNNAIQYSKWKIDGLRKMKVLLMNIDTCSDTFNKEHLYYHLDYIHVTVLIQSIFILKITNNLFNDSYCFLLYIAPSIFSH